MSDDEDWRERAVAITTFLVLGVGFVAMFLSIEWFWMVWVLGFAVLVPMLAVLLGIDEEEEESIAEQDGRTTRDSGDTSEYRGTGETGADALQTLRERYARGDLTDEQFERKLDRLLETETIEDVEDARRRLETERTGEGGGPGGTDDETRTERER